MSGIDRFISDLEKLGFSTERRGNLVLVELDVSPEEAPALNQVGTDPPKDFPHSPPHWLHLPKKLVLEDEDGRASELGEEWRKWSRKHPSWPSSADAIQSWLAHARSLMLSARIR